MKEYYSREEMLAAIETGLLENGDEFKIEGGNLDGFTATFNNNDLLIKLVEKDIVVGIGAFLECERFKYINNDIYQDIDIQKIVEVPDMSINNDVTSAVIAFYKTINQLVKAVKKLDKKL